MSYPNIYDDGDWTVAQPDGDFVSDRPFAEQGDPDHQVILWPHVQARSNYTPLELDTPHPTIATAYLANELGFQDIGGGIMRWFREYSTIPATRIERTGTEVFKFPGLPVGTESGNVITINSITAVSNGIRLNVTDADGITVGDQVRVNVRTSSGGTSFVSSGFYRVLAGSNSTGIIVANFPRGTTFVAGSLFEAQGSRQVFSQVQPTITQFDYFLPGVTANITTPEDIAVAQPFRPIIESTGVEVDWLSAGTSPTAAQYRDFIVNGELLVISSDVRRYKGNIYERVTKYVRAI